MPTLLNIHVYSRQPPLNRTGPQNHCPIFHPISNQQNGSHFFPKSPHTGESLYIQFHATTQFLPRHDTQKILFYQSRFLFLLCASSTVMTIGWVIFFPSSLFLTRGTDRLVWSACLYLYKSEYFLFIESTMYLSEREMGLYFQRKILGFVFCTIYGYVAPTPPCLMAPLNKFRA